MSSSRSIWPLVVAGALAGSGLLGAAWWLGKPAAVQPQAVTLYLADTQGMYLVPVETRLAAPTDPAAWANAVFERLRTPGTPRLVAPVAADAVLAEATWTPPRWTLAVKLARAPGSTDERMLVGALVRTFTAGWPGAKEVRIKLMDAAGQPLASQHLDLAAPLTVADVANTLDAGAATSGVKSTLWWPSKDGGALVPVQLTLTGGTGIPPRDAFERLIAGPPAEAASFLARVVPAGASPRWVSLEAGVARVELAGSLGKGDGDRPLVEATVLTLTEFPDVQAVQFLEAGRPISRVVGPFQLGAPVSRPATAAPPAATAHRPAP